MSFSILSDDKALTRISARIEEASYSRKVPSKTISTFVTLPTRHAKFGESLFFVPTSDTIRALRGDMPKDD